MILGGQLGHVGFSVLELVVEDAVAVDVRLYAPVFDLNGLFQLVEVCGGAVEDLEEPTSQREDGGALIHVVVVGLCVNVPNEGLSVRGVVTRESRHLSIPHFLDPPCWLRQAILAWDVELRGPSVPVNAIPLGALLGEGLPLLLVELSLKVLDELPGFGLFLESLPFSLTDGFNEALSHSVEYIGVLQIGLYDRGGRPRGHGGDRGFVGNGGAGESGHVLGAVGVVPGTGVVFAEEGVDEGVGLGELVGEEKVELSEPLLGKELEFGRSPGEVGAERFGGLSGCEGSR